jgi:hypothetical protein
MLTVFLLVRNTEQIRKQTWQDYYFVKTVFSVCMLLCVTDIWLGKVSVNTTKVVLQSINIQIEFYFLPLYVSVLMGPSSGSTIIIRLKLFELPNMD